MLNMSNSIKELYDYDLMKNCSKCGNISLKSNFHKNKNTSDGYHIKCKRCMKEYYNDNYIRIIQKQKIWYNNNKQKILQNQLKYEKLRREIDSNFKLGCNLRNRTIKTFKAQNVSKTNKTMEMLDCSHSFFKNWIESQLYGNMTMQNYGKVWNLDHCLAVSTFNLLDENEMRKCFNWTNLRPMYVRDNIIKGNKIDYWLYLLQEVKAKYFLKVNE